MRVTLSEHGKEKYAKWEAIQGLGKFAADLEEFGEELVTRNVEPSQPELVEREQRRARSRLQCGTHSFETPVQVKNISSERIGN